MTRALHAIVAAAVLGAGLATGAAGASTASGDDPGHDRLTFIQHCSGCHLADGSGSPAKGVPSMRGALGRFLQVPGGREFIVQVPGVMNSPLSDAQIAALMNWLVPDVSRETLPEGVRPYTAEEIARLRRSRPVDVMAARRAVVTRGRGAGIDIDAPAPLPDPSGIRTP